MHQLTCWLRNKDLRVFAYLADMGTGKSKMLIDTVAWLYDQGQIDSLVLVAPKGVYRNWADSELRTHMPAHVRYKVGCWSSEGRKADLDSLDALRPSANDYDLHVLLVNVEALGRNLEDNRAYAYLQKFLCEHKSMLAVDESTSIKNRKATRTQALLKLRRYAPYRRILSGQPAPNGPMDLYSQCEFLEPGLLGFDSFYSFQAHHAELVPMSMHLPNGKKRNFKTIARKDGKPQFKNLGELHRRLSKFAMIVKKEDCLDLPPKVYQTRHVELGKEQRRAYQDMVRLSIVEIERSLTPGQGDCPASNLSTANLVITQMLRLHQILCGFIVSDERKAVPFDSNPRLDALMESLDEVRGKAVVWATWKLNIRQIAERIAQEYGPESVVTFYGETSVEDRRKASSHFDPNHPDYNPDSPVRFIVSNKTGARGNTWIAAHTAIYYSTDYDFDTRAQSEDRIHRIGQGTSCTYLDLVAPGTQNERVLAALRSKLDIAGQITSSNWREWIK